MYEVTLLLVMILEINCTHEVYNDYSFIYKNITRYKTIGKKNTMHKSIILYKVLMMVINIYLPLVHHTLHQMIPNFHSLQTSQLGHELSQSPNTQKTQVGILNNNFKMYRIVLNHVYLYAFCNSFLCQSF